MVKRRCYGRLHPGEQERPAWEGQQGSMSTSQNWFDRPFIYPQEIRQMDDGFMLSYSDEFRGRPLRHYAPMYWDLPEYAKFKQFDAGAR